MRKLFVLVRGDLSKSQQAVQAGHAVANACLAGVEWGNGTLVYLKVRDLDELNEWFAKSEKAFPFYEPDIGSEMTAFSVLGELEGFEQLRLL